MEAMSPRHRPCFQFALLAAAFALVPTLSMAATMFVGQVITTAANFCPLGWAEMNGQLLAVSQYPDLYQMIGNTYGGSSAQGTFALPTTLPNFTGTTIAVRDCIALTGPLPTPP
jgi:hypothetical protein